MIDRSSILKIFSHYREGAPVVTGPGFGSRMLHGIGHHPATIYNMELGYTVPVALGLALSLPGQLVYALEGDGSMLAGLSVLSTIGRYQPTNLTVIVFDNRSYATTGAIPSASTMSTDLSAVARACGIEHLSAVGSAEAFEAALLDAADVGPRVIVVELEPETVADVQSAPAFPFDIVEAAINTRRNLEERGLVPTLWSV